MSQWKFGDVLEVGSDRHKFTIMVIAPNCDMGMSDYDPIRAIRLDDIGPHSRMKFRKEAWWQGAPSSAYSVRKVSK